MRRNRAKVRSVLPDPKYKDIWVTKFINGLMKDGEKAIAMKILYGAMEKLAEEAKGDALELFKKAVHNIMPEVEVHSKRIGGANYQVPREVPHRRRLTLAIRWITEAAKKRSEKTMIVKLYKELLDAIDNKGGAFKKKDEVRRMAESNRAYAHYS